MEHGRRSPPPLKRLDFYVCAASAVSQGLHVAQADAALRGREQREVDGGGSSGIGSDGIGTGGRRRCASCPGAMAPVYSVT